MNDTGSSTEFRTTELRTTTVDIDVPLPGIWTFNDLGADQRDQAEAELIDLLRSRVDDPESVAKASYDEFMERVGGGSAPLLLASFREETDDGSVLGASLTVAKNNLTGDLDAWRDAYPDAVDLTVGGEPAIRTFDHAKVEVTGVFDEPLTVLTWRYVVAFDPRSVLLFTFSSPNSELADIFLEHFDDIMADVRIMASPTAGA